MSEVFLEIKQWEKTKIQFRTFAIGHLNEMGEIVKFVKHSEFVKTEWFSFGPPIIRRCFKLNPKFFLK